MWIEIENVVDVLTEDSVKVRVCVCVSSDSEVFGDGKRLKDGSQLFEMDAVRPADEDLSDELTEEDEYGDEKLGGEELLKDQGKSGNGFPCVSLRFANVIGAHDQTDRFITLISNFHVPAEVLKRAESIILAMNAPNSWKDAYNIAFEEEFNVTQGIEFIAKSIIN